MKKIIVNKDDTTSAVVRKMLGTLDKDITLVIPKNSKVGTSLNNFHILNREAEAAGKKLAVESVDEEVLAYAKVAGLTSDHPFLGRPGLQDIVPRTKASPVEIAARHFKEAKTKSSRGRKAAVKEEEVLPEEKPQEIFLAPVREEEEVKPHRRGSRKSRWTIWAVGGMVAVGAAGIWAVGAFWGRAEVTVRLEEYPWSLKSNFVADATVSKPNAAQKILPAEAFSLDRNITQTFPAAGVQNVEESAQGTITIYNAYSSTAQALVATTRFTTSDGKIFRLKERVTVPGATVKDGAITPASITATVIAEKAGPSYNIGPVSRLTIPAFKGTPKYDGFYGVLSEGAKGGFIGAKKVATERDIAAAKTKTVEILKGSLESLFIATKPSGFHVPEGAMSFILKRVVVNEKTDAQGNFNVFGEATLSAVGFREEDLVELVRQYAATERGGAPLTFRSFEFTAKSINLDIAAKRNTFSADINAVLTTVFAPETFKDSIKNLSVESAQSAIGRISGLAEGKVSLWPFWIKRVPADASRIVVKVE
ncbi:MAG: hypothetical protein FJY98_03770 [Candidatus Liptonbacteria bacterium]|nr:hypothetical protein [Candidatus Liptonbacteria bacterium]